MGPLDGLKVVEMAGLGPGPFCAMMLGDMGAEVVRIDRPGATTVDGDPNANINNRSRKSVALNLKSEAGRDAALRLISQADALIEGFRPGVMERLGLGPDVCMERNPKLIYGRMTVDPASVGRRGRSWPFQRGTGPRTDCDCKLSDEPEARTHRCD